MKITINQLNGLKCQSWQVRFWLDGNRQKKNFKSKTEAEDFVYSLKRLNEKKSVVETAKSFGIDLSVGSNIERRSIEDAMADMYRQRYASAFNKDSVKQERFNYNYFGKFIYESMKRDFCDEITLLDLEKFRQMMKEKSLSNATIERRFNFVRAFLNYCVAHNYRKDNPASLIKKLYVENKKAVLWSIEDCEKLLSDLPNWARDFAEVLQDTMARPIELCRLEVRDVNLFKKTVRLVSGKGASVHERIVPLTDRSFEILRSLLAGKSEKEKVFRNSKGDPVKTDIFDKAVRLSRERLGLSKDLKPYGFRHGGLTKLSQLNVSQKLISEIAGHRKAQTTQRYLHTGEEELRKVINLTEVLRRRA